MGILLLPVSIALRKAGDVSKADAIELNVTPSERRNSLTVTPNFESDIVLSLPAC